MSEYSVRGELIEDELIFNTQKGKDVCRIYIRTASGIVNYNVSGTREQLENLTNRLVGLHEPRAPQGDEIAIKPKEGDRINVGDIALVESYSPRIKVIFPGKRKEDYRLSNGMKIPAGLVRELGDFEKGKVIVIDMGNSKDDFWIYDEGDGKPYYYTSDGNSIQRYENGRLAEDTTQKVKRFELTYKFCNVEGHGPYPVWEPRAFRSDPCYGKIKQEK